MNAVENPLLTPLRDLLQSPGPARSEHQLIEALKARELVARDYSLDPLQLFRVHFCVFNALYRLRDEFLPRGLTLDISPLAIVCRAVIEGERQQALVSAGDDALECYYRDWGNYEAATGESVAQLLAEFWRRLEGRADGPARAGALAELGLTDPVSDTEIRQRYRSLAMTHHPDRGGDARRLQELNAAMEVLRP